MGIRALLEQVMIAKVGDIRGFNKKLDAFQEAGFISSLQRDAMRATLDVGDAAMHRAFKPTESESQTALARELGRASTPLQKDSDPLPQGL